MGADVKLAERLRISTQDLHRAAEQSGIMRCLLSRNIDRAAYCLLLRNLYPIYATLESALDRNASHPEVSAIRYEKLYRRSALTRDLDALHGESWPERLVIVSTAGDYVRRLLDLEVNTPQLLVAHAYVRYLGDLNGGQSLRGIVTELFDLPEDHGTAFYDFSQAGDIAVLISQFRAGLDAVSVDETDGARIAAEAQLAFRLHIRLFEELAPRVEMATGGQPPRA